MSTKLEDRLGEAQEKLSKIQHKMQTSARITMIAGIIVLALIGGYFWYGYTQIKVLLEPENLVNMTGDMIDDQLPERRKQLEQFVVKSAPDWAKQGSEFVVNSAPDFRKRLEDYSLTRTKEIVDELSTISEAEFKKILKENPDAIKSAVKDLTDNDNVSVDAIQAIETALEGEMEYSIKEQSNELLAVLKTMKQRLERLQANKNLTEEEKLEREILMIVRHLQNREIDVKDAGKQLGEVIDVTGESNLNGAKVN